MSNLQMLYSIFNEDSSVVNLAGESGINALDTSAPFAARTGIIVNDDGTIDKHVDTGSGPTITQIDSGTDWIIPNGSASGDYEFFITVNSGTNPNYMSDSLDTWISVTGGLQWIVERTTAGTSSWNWTLSVRFDGGSTIDSGTYSGFSSASL